MSLAKLSFEICGAVLELTTTLKQSLFFVFLLLQEPAELGVLG
jgi:hypothetical protein